MSDPDGTQDEYRAASCPHLSWETVGDTLVCARCGLDLTRAAASCGDPECPEEHGDEGVHLAPWGGPVPQPKVTRRRGLARAWMVRAAIVVLAVVLVLLLGWVR